MRLSLDKLIGFWSRATPDSLAIETPTRRITYKHLYEQSRMINVSLLENSIPYGIVVRDSIDFLYLIISMMREGKVFVVLGTNINPSDMSDFLRANSIAHIITDDDLHIYNCNIINISELKFNTSSFVAKNQHLSDTVGGFLSSGSTGVPKVFYRSQYSLISEALMWIMELQLTKSTSFFLSPPFAYIGSFVLLYSVLYSGGRILVNDVCSETGYFFDCSGEIDFALLMPKMIREIEASDYDISLKNVITMGAPITTEEKKKLSKKLNCNVYEMWGNSEGLATITNLYEDPDCSSLGRATFTDEIVIVDENRNILPPHVIGWIAGITDNTANNYSGDSLIVSGDMGYIDSQCNLHLLGREGDVIVFPNGGYFSCSNLCQDLRKLIEIEDLAVVLVSRKVYCFIQSKPLYAQEVRDFFNNVYGQYSDYISLGGVFYCDIPYNANGKIDYEELRKDKRIRM